MSANGTKLRGAVVLAKQPYRRGDGKNIGRHVWHIVRKSRTKHTCYSCQKLIYPGDLYASYLGDGLCLDCVDPTLPIMGSPNVKRMEEVNAG